MYVLMNVEKTFMNVCKKKTTPKLTVTYFKHVAVAVTS